VRLALLACLAWAGCGSPRPIPPTCNGAVELCARAFDRVAFATAHNAMSNRDDGWIAPNQEHPIARQLGDGVRALMLDIHYHSNAVALCHEYCILGSLPLVDALRVIRKFLDSNRGEIITIIFESYVAAADAAAAFAASGLLRYAWAQPPGAPWPTLGELIAVDKRLVVLSDREGGALPWYLDLWRHAWETPYAFSTPDEFTCARYRGAPDGALFILNHFLTAPLAGRDLAVEANGAALLGERARRCQLESGRLPNFVAVDFYATGDLFSVVQALNAQ
jgi:hypothetical protein